MIVAALGISGTLGGVILGQQLTRSWQREQWLSDNRKQECSDLLTALTNSYLTLLKYHRELLPQTPEIDTVISQSDIEITRILHDRIFIAEEVARERLGKRWIDAIEHYRGEFDAIAFAVAFSGMQDAILQIALAKVPKHLLQMRSDDGSEGHQAKHRRRLHLRGWARIGIVASILWIICGGIWGNNVGIHEGDYVMMTYEDCLRSVHTDMRACQVAFDKDWPLAIAHHWWYAGFFALAPLPLAWAAAYALRAIVRWIRSGFIADA